MKLLTVLLIFCINSAIAVCLVPISRDNINPGQIPTSEKYNADFDDLYERANEVPGDCLLELSVRAKQITDDSIGTDHFVNASVTAAKIASDALPSFEKPLRVRAYRTSSEWTKQSDVEKILVMVVGGGGGAGGSGDASVAAGGSSSFGAHCVATGGSFGKGASTGGAGTGSSGDINLSGDSGERSFATPVPRGGRSMLGHFGKGGHNESGVAAGGGGFCMKLISKSSLADRVTVTVGSGGAGAPLLAPRQNGKSGIVLIYEFGR